jgi:hypothetical protein
MVLTIALLVSVTWKGSLILVRSRKPAASLVR